MDLDKLTVDKNTFGEALVAEGIPISASYTMAMPGDYPWARDKAVFGTSHQPWSSPQYKGDPNAVYETPNIWETDKYVFRFHVHEGFADQDVADVVAGLEKVETAYLK